MSRVGVRRLFRPQLAFAAVMVLSAIAAPVAIAAEGERVLDPQLSLIGGCKEETLDPIEDPGCPTTPPPGAHPPSTFSNPRAVAADDYGNIYVSSFGSSTNGSKGRIDIFDAEGRFISELIVQGPSVPLGPTSMAIDSEGYLYVIAKPELGELLGPIRRFAPDAPYEPAAGKIHYSNPSVVLADSWEGNYYTGLAIDRDNDHLFANWGSAGIQEYASAAEGNERVSSTEPPGGGGNVGMAIDTQRNRMYASAGDLEERINIFDLNSVIGTPPDAEYEQIGSIEDSALPAGNFGQQLSVAVNEGNGNVFVLDGENCHLYEFDEDGNYLATIPIPFVQCTYGGEIGVDNGPFSPNGQKGEEQGGSRYLYVPSHSKGIGHSFAFFESTVAPPVIESTTTANISEDEAELQAQIDPNNLETTYSFEIQAEGSSDWTPVGGGTLSGNLVAAASAAATGLTPGTSYRFRVHANNEEGSDEAEGSFATYPNTPTESGTCPNSLLRTGLSALLPDCRAYELVTPADTNARAPLGAEVGNLTRQVSPAGDKVPFRVEGGSLPGLGGTGSLRGDPYLATRTSSGWSTAYTGPGGAEATIVVPETTSPDQGYSFYRAEVSGSAVLAPITTYVRYPDGHAEPLGQGGLERIDPEAVGQQISEGGGHIVFATGVFTEPPVQLEPDAAPDGTRAVYDRTADGVTHVVSLKPNNEPFGAGENALYMGGSVDAEGIAFSVNGTLYLRYRNSETFQIGTGVAFAGVAEGGGRIFYVEGGNLKAFEVEGEGVIDFTTTGDVIPVTVAGAGTAAYFVSPSVLGGANPQGAVAQAGEQNLYRSVEGQIEFLGTVTDRDLKGKTSPDGDGLGLWVKAINNLGAVPARSTADGSVFLFKSRAALTGYDSEGHAEIYRYDASAGELDCISCNPTGAAALSDATLQSESREGGAKLFSSLVWPENLRADGRRAFFESSDALVAADGDRLQDVYEWEDQGVGSCTKPGGCLHLISSPQSGHDEYLWAVSRSGDDVFFLSSELLVGADADGTPSIYDARVGGGFAEETRSGCEGEGCRPRLSQPPVLPGTETPVRGPGDNVKRVRCPRGKHKVKRAGRVRCVKNRKHHRKHRAGTGRKGGRR